MRRSHRCPCTMCPLQRCFSRGEQALRCRLASCLCTGQLTSFCSASEDIPQCDEVRAYLKSLREARQSKILAGLSAVNSEHLNVSGP